MDTVSIFGANISRMSLDETLSSCEERLKKHQGGHVCFVNVHVITENAQNPALRDSLNRAFIACPDGVPLQWVARFKNEPIRSRVCGPDFTPLFLKKHPELHYGFIGGPPGLAEKIVSKFNLSATCYSPPMRPFSPENARDDWEQFLKKCPGGNAPPVVWIGLGAPKQELWAGTISPLAPHTLFFVVGAVFDFLADHKKRAPIWMQKLGLEWFHRLLSEPGRLWKRYLINNFLFLVLWLKETKKIRKSS